MSALSQRVNEALASGNVEQLKQIIGSDPEALAKAVSAPVGVERIAVFPVEDFGSAMAPLYTTLAPVGGVVADHGAAEPGSSERAKREAGVDPKSWQLFFGRYGAPFVLAFMQSTVVCLGNMLFVGSGCQPAAVPCVLLDGGLRVQFHRLHAGVAVRQPWQGACRAAAHHLCDRRRWQLPLQLLPSFFQAVSPFFAGDASSTPCAQRAWACTRTISGCRSAQPVAFVVPFVIMGILRPVLALHVLVRGTGGEIEGGCLAAAAVGKAGFSGRGPVSGRALFSRMRAFGPVRRFVLPCGRVPIGSATRRALHGV